MGKIKIRFDSKSEVAASIEEKEDGEERVVYIDKNEK